MASFIPSSIQKRLLRYALSRLELLDTDALDLERLDIAWGRRSTAELKDVGLRKAKLASLLQLPSRLTIEKADVSLLRLTVPADIQTSSVVIEVDGLTAQLKVLEQNGRTNKESDRDRKSRRQRNKSGTSQQPKRASFRDEAEDDEEPQLPTTGDLAASFLAEEPAEERRQLEAAFNSQSTADLRQSVASNEDFDEDLAYGTGVAFTLPGFLANFLAGITDRLQFIVRNVSIELDVDLDVSSDDAIDPIVSPTRLSLYLDEFEFGSLELHPDFDNSASAATATGSSTQRLESQMKSLKRRISLKQIRGTLATEATVFEQLSRVFDGDNAWAKNRGASSGIPHDIDTRSLTSSPVTTFTPDGRASTAPDLGPQLSKVDSASENMPQQPRPTRSTSPSALLTDSLTFNEPSLSHETKNLIASDSLTDSHLQSSSPNIHDSLRSFRQERFSSGSHIPRRDRQAQAHPSPRIDTRSKSPAVRVPGGFGDESSWNEDPLEQSGTFGQHDRTQEHVFADEHVPGEEDELYESKLFTHEDAESLYMSAIGDDEVGFERTTSQSLIDAEIASPLDSSPQESRSSDEDDGQQSRLAFKSFEQSTSTSAQSEPLIPTEPVNTLDPRNCAAKAFLLVDLVEIFLPHEQDKSSDAADTDQDLAYGDESNPTLDRSAVRELPGAFSVYAESTTSARRQERPSRGDAAVSSAQSSHTSAKASQNKQSPHPLEVVVHTVQARADLSMCRLFFQLQKRLQAVFHSDQQPVQEKGTTKDSSYKHDETPAESRYYCQKLNFTFLNNIEQIDPATHLFPGQDKSNGFETHDEGSLFTSEIERAQYSISQSNRASESILNLGKFRLGFVDEQVVSFSTDVRMRTSLRDINEIQHNDVRVNFIQSDASLEVHVSTLPLKVVVDLQRLDDTFSNFGGLSGLLELGSSIMSEATVTNDNPRQSRPRAVRFDVPKQAPVEGAQPRHVKVNARVGGFSATLKGKHCSVTHQTSAIKVISRDAVVAIAIDDMRFSGPFLQSAPRAAPLTARIRNTSLKYLFSPEEHDLTRLISLLTPSKDKFQEDDDFLVDTLIRQRKKGAVLRLNVGQTEVDVHNLDAVTSLQELVAEMSKMSNVTKYFPQESRPGVLTLGLVDAIIVKVQTGSKLGEICADLRQIELAHVGLPSLVAFAVAKVKVDRDDDSPLVGEVLTQQMQGQPAMIMARMIGDDLEPALKFKLWNVCFEYTVPLVMAVLDLKDEPQEDEEIDLAASITNLAGRRDLSRAKTFSSEGSDESSASTKLFRLDFAARDCAIGLNPLNMNSRALFVLSDSRITTSLPFKDAPILKFDLHKAAVLIIDDHNKLVAVDESSPAMIQPSTGKQHISNLCRQGYVSVSSISAASVVVKIIHDSASDEDCLDIELRDELFVLETCADSTQTLIETLNALKPPMPPSKGVKYRTEIAPIEDMMASFTGDAYALGSVAGDQFEDPYDQDLMEALDEGDLATDFDGLGDLGQFDEEIEQSQNDIVFRELGRASHSVPLRPSQGKREGSLEEEYVTGQVQLGAMPAQIQGNANKWDSINNKYIPVSRAELAKSPLNVRVRDVHVIWNLYDGYDWQSTRETITKAVQDVEARAEEKRAAKRLSATDEDDESVIGDFLFNSIYIGIPVNHDPKDLSRQINRNIDDLTSETGTQSRRVSRNVDDLASETGTYTSTVTSGQSHSRRSPRPRGRKLKLERSKRHKVAFELRGLSVDLFNFAPHEETQTSVDIRVRDLEVFDHVPTSTWKKFATYMQDAGPREERKPMIHLEVCNVRPVPELTATELVIRVTVLPLRLHVDQDALDFITRFFEFNDDDEANAAPPAEQPYLQRVEVRPVSIKLDYKPKKVDYAGLRSGRSTEFMNFFILDGADILLKHAIVYGCSGFLKLHHSLEDVWMPDVKRNQLPAVLSGLNGVRTLVNVGTGVRDLIVIPIREYQKDGRIVRSISKGAVAFAKSTGSELTRFGAKLAVGAQTALQGAEGFFGRPGQEGDAGWEVADLDPEERRVISHYADQPAGILQGLKGAARSLERDLLLTKDVIIAVAGEIRESGSAEGAARAVVKHAPTLILRPMIGASKAVSQTLMGATNTVDPTNRRKIEDKYKRY